MSTGKFFCPICDRLIRDDSEAIFCNFCNSWVHPKCNLLNSQDFKTLCDSNPNESWSCLKCNCEILPFASCFSITNDDSELTSTKNSPALQTFLDSASSLLTDDSSEVEDPLAPHKIHCNYYDPDEFNSTLPEHSGLSLFHLNINSLSKHFDNLNLLLDSLNHRFKIIGISETRINEVTSINLDLPGYSSLFTNSDAACGGTCLYICDSLTFKSRDDLSKSLDVPRQIESTFAEIYFDNRPNLIVGCIYNHPSYPINIFNERLATSLHSLSKEGKQLILLGDFNINLLKYDNSPEVKEFIDILSSYLIAPSISLPTRVTVHSQTLIDNILFTPNNYKVISGNLTVGISDHMPQFLMFESPSYPKDPPEFFYRNWKIFDKENFILDFLALDWNKLLKLEEKNPDISFSNFYKEIDNLMDRYAPLKKVSKKQCKMRHKQWVTPGIRKSIHKRNQLYKQFIKCKNAEQKLNLHLQFKSYRNSIVNLLRISKNNHYKRYFNFNIQNSRQLWKGIREIIQNNKSAFSNNISLNINDNLVSDPNIVSNSFNEFFTSVASKIRDNINPSTGSFKQHLKNNPLKSFFFRPTDGIEVAEIISSLNPKKASGPHSIPPQILNTILPDISRILADIFNLSFETGSFIDSLKLVKVIPVYKNKGSPLDTNNYRPISLLSNIDKILEKLVYSRLISFLDKENLLYQNQFGFRSKHATSHALIKLTEQIRASLDRGNFSCGIFIDLQKAFDTVDHEILLEKLKYYGVRGLANKWFRSYLTNRKQFVFISGHCSHTCDILHGVPQGSVLGPLLFLIYINDLPHAITYSQPTLFADDTSLLFSNKDLQLMEHCINLDLNSLLEWLNVNKIALNATKTEAILFRNARKHLNYNIKLELNGNQLQFTSNVRYLGVTIDEFLSWSYHLNTLASKLRKSNGILSKLRHYLPAPSMISIYHALFNSHLSYASQIWGQNLPLNSRILKLQKSAIRLITFSDYTAHTKPLFKNTKILPIRHQIFVSNTSLCHQILNQNCPLSIISSFNLNYLSDSHITRGQQANALSRPAVRTSTYGINSVRYQTILNWNELQLRHNDIDLKSLSLAQIKSFSNDLLQSSS